MIIKCDIDHCYRGYSNIINIKTKFGRYVDIYLQCTKFRQYEV